jgi:hypothetical protein
MLGTGLRCRNADAGGIYPSMPMPSYAIKYSKQRSRKLSQNLLFGDGAKVEKYFTYI